MNDSKICAVPNLNADIIPEKSAGGYEIGMNFNDFLNKISNNFIHLDKMVGLLLSAHDSWVVEWFSNEYYVDYKYAYWNNTVILRFGTDNKLNCITLKNGYHGKLFNKVAINDRLGVLSDDYYFLFYFDTHFLVNKLENRKILEKYITDNELYDIDIDDDFDVMSIIYDVDDIIAVQGIELNTDYLTQYSREYPNQIIQDMVIFCNQD